MSFPASHSFSTFFLVHNASIPPQTPCTDLCCPCSLYDDLRLPIPETHVPGLFQPPLLLLLRQDPTCTLRSILLLLGRKAPIILSTFSSNYSLSYVFFSF